MYVKQVKRKCNVRGCKNTDSFAISRTREIGNTVIICKSCLGKALGTIDDIDPETKSNFPVPDKNQFPPLFFNEEALGIKTEAIAVDEAITPEYAPNDNKEPENKQSGVASPVDNVTNFKCHICGKEFDSERGLKTHRRYCKPQTDVENKGAETE